jgi:hypothetical protein
MDNIIPFILNRIFRFAYPVGFVGAIMYSIGTVISIDFFSAVFNKGIIVFLNIYVGICGYIAFCTFFDIQVEVGDYIIDFDNIYVAVGIDKTNNNGPILITNKHNHDISVIPGKTQISITG